METTERVSPAGRLPMAQAFQWGSGDDDFVYEGVRLHTDDPGKLIPFIDQLLLFLRVTRRKARPVTIRESKGVIEIRWSGRAPKAFRPGAHSLLCISEGKWVDSFTVQAA